VATNPLSPACSRRVDQLEFGIDLASAPVLLQQAGVRELGLGVLVESFEVGIGRRGVEVEVTLLDVLAVVALRPAQPEEALLEDGVAAVPQGQGEAQATLAIAYAEQAVLAPAVGSAAGVLVWEVVPGVAVGAVILAHRAPLPLAQVRPPALPVGDAGVPLREAPAFRRGMSVWRHD